MVKRLPSLTALRTFEAAARHLSFAKAASELFVTPAAVGFQVKQLEAELGGALFLRKHRAVELTPRGLRLSENLGPAFSSIADAWSAAQEPMEQTVLRVTGPPRALHDWVLPAVSSAKNELGLQVSWDMTKAMKDIAMGEADMAIRWAREPTSDLHWTPLLRTWFTPLVRPDVARYVEQPSDLLKCGLIGVDYRSDADDQETMWSAWCRLNDLDMPAKFAVTCTDTASAVETALATGHTAIAGSFLAHDHLEKGDLIAPFNIAVAPFSRFWLVCQNGFEATEEYRWFLQAVRDGASGFDVIADEMRLFHPDGSTVMA